MSAVHLLRVSVHERIIAGAEDFLLLLKKGQEPAELPVLRALLIERLAAAAEEIVALLQRTVAEYEDRVERSQREIFGLRRLLDALLKPEVRLHRADVQNVSVGEEEQQQQQSASLDQENPEPRHIKEEQGDHQPRRIKEEREDPDPPHIKEEPQDHWVTAQEEAEITKFTFTPVSVKCEDDEEKPQSSQLHHAQTRSSAQHVKTEADEDDRGGSEPADTPDPARLSQPDINDEKSDSSETDDSDDEWINTRSGLMSNMYRSTQVPAADRRYNTREKSHTFPEGWQMFCPPPGLNLHNKIHPREAPAHRGVSGISIVVDREPEPVRSTVLAAAGGEVGDGWTEPMEAPSDAHVNNEVSDTGCDSGNDSFSCSTCGKSFQRRDSLKRHLATHAGVKPFSCPFCSRGFAQEGNLRQHMSIHTGEKRWSCSVCERKFTWHKQLKKHKCGDTSQVQTEEEMRRMKPFICPECGKGFGFKENLKRHIRLHRGEKRYKCSACDERFTWSYQLKNHECALQAVQLRQSPAEGNREAGRQSQPSYQQPTSSITNYTTHWQPHTSH